MFLCALSCPWFVLRGRLLAEDPYLKDMYVHCALGLIESRRGDLRELRNFYLPVEIQPLVKEAFDRAIEEAQVGQGADPASGPTAPAGTGRKRPVRERPRSASRPAPLPAGALEQAATLDRLERQAATMDGDGRTAEALRIRDKALDILTALHVDMSYRRVSCQVEAGSILVYLLRRPEEADPLLDAAVTFPWYLVEEDTGHRLRQLNAEGARWLIQCRLGKPELLREIEIAPAIRGEIPPNLLEALDAAHTHDKDP